MREVKFRIRLKNKASGKELTMYNDLFNRHYGYVFYEIDRREWELVSADEFVGYKSKNGEDIFENDILEYKNEFGRRHIHKVFYKDGGLCINIHNNDIGKDVDNILFYSACADEQTKGWLKQCEVIGNIFENKDLLK